MKIYRYRSGWYGDNYRHSLAARGIKSSNRLLFAVRGYKTTEPIGSEGEENIDISTEVTSDTGKKGTGWIRQKRQEPKATPGKVTEAIALDTFAKAYGSKDFSDFIERLKVTGNISQARDMLGEDLVKNDIYRQNLIKDAVFQGASARVSAGENVDLSELKGLGLSSARIKNLDDQMRVAQKDVFMGKGYVREKAGKAVGGVKGGLGFLAGEAEDIGARGLKNMMSDTGQPRRSVWEELEQISGKKSVRDTDNLGLFNPLRAAHVNVDAIDEKKRVVERSYKDSNRAKNEVDAIYFDRANFASVNMSAFDKGNKAFNVGDREGLIKNITDLEAEHGKIKDRWNMVQDVRRLVQSPENRDQTIHKAKSATSFFSFGGGASQLADETKKISEIEKKLKNSSNMLSARVGMLRNKLRRINAAIPPSSSVPEKINVIGESGGDSVFSINSISNLLDDNKGKMSYVLNK